MQDDKMNLMKKPSIVCQLLEEPVNVQTCGPGVSCIREIVSFRCLLTHMDMYEFKFLVLCRCSPVLKTCETKTQE